MKTVFATLAAMIAALTATGLEARERKAQKPAQITVQPRSPMDAGTEVKADTLPDNRYATQPGTTPLTAADYGINLGSSLPSRFEGGKPFQVDFRAPRELMR